MYLKSIIINNIGSIKDLNLLLPFNLDNSPQPVILVGVNGSGKSIVLSYIVDAIEELLIKCAKQHYSKNKDEHATLKNSDKHSISVNEKYSLAYLSFRQQKSYYNMGFYDKPIEYVEKYSLDGLFSFADVYEKTDKNFARTYLLPWIANGSLYHELEPILF
jgi:hypothetical protein